MRREPGPLSGWIDDAKAQWDSAIANFQAQRAALDQAESALYDVSSLAQADPDDAAEWQKNFKRINASKSAMDAAAGAVTTVADWWRSAISYIPGMSGYVRQGLSGALGIALPAFPISVGAIIAMGATAAAAVSATYAFIAYINAKTSKFQQYIDAGMDPETAAEQASDDAQRESGYSIGARLQNIALIALAGVALVMLTPRMLPRKK